MLCGLVVDFDVGYEESCWKSAIDAEIEYLFVGVSLECRRESCRDIVGCT